VFDIAFSEIVVIAVVALVVIGPERLPKVARTLGHMFGRLQRYVNEVKADISREMELDELRKLKSEVQSAARDIETSMTDAARSFESGARSIEAQLNEGASSAATTGEGASSAAATGDDAAKALSEGNIPADPHAAAAATAPVSANATSAAADAPRQAALPGFDRI
jgi:sec-independent protein translocase protein TatB